MIPYLVRYEHADTVVEVIQFVRTHALKRVFVRIDVDDGRKPPVSRTTRSILFMVSRMKIIVNIKVTLKPNSEMNGKKVLTHFYGP